MFKYTSKIGVAKPKSNSLRVGLPKEIVQLLDVSSGDTLEWGVDVTNDKVTIIASKSK